MVVDEADPVGDPVAEVVGGLGGDLVAAGLSPRHGGCAGLGQQVAPGAVEKLSRDDVVAVSLGHEDGEVGEPARVGGEAGIEGQGAVEDRGPGVAGRVVQHQAAGEGGAAAEPGKDEGRPGCAAASSQPRNQSIVSRSEAATGRPMPRLANHAYPPPSPIGARTAAYAGPVGRCEARPRMSCSLEPRPCSRTTSGAAGSSEPYVATTGAENSAVMTSPPGPVRRPCVRRPTDALPRAGPAARPALR